MRTNREILMQSNDVMAAGSTQEWVSMGLSGRIGLFAQDSKAEEKLYRSSYEK